MPILDANGEVEFILQQVEDVTAACLRERTRVRLTTRPGSHIQPTKPRLRMSPAHFAAGAAHCHSLRVC